MVNATTGTETYFSECRNYTTIDEKMQEAGCRNFFVVTVVIHTNDEPINGIGQTYRRYV